MSHLSSAVAIPVAVLVFVLGAFVSSADAQGGDVSSCPRVRTEQLDEFDRVVGEYADQGQAARFFAMTIEEEAEYVEELTTTRLERTYNDTLSAEAERKLQSGFGPCDDVRQVYLEIVGTYLAGGVEATNAESQPPSDGGDSSPVVLSGGISVTVGGSGPRGGAGRPTSDRGGRRPTGSTAPLPGTVATARVDPCVAVTDVTRTYLLDRLREFLAFPSDAKVAGRRIQRGTVRTALRQNQSNNPRDVGALWQRNLDATGETAQQLYQLVVDDLAHVVAVGENALSYYQNHQQDLAGSVQRDISRGVLGPESPLGGFLADIPRAIADPTAYRQYDPLYIVQNAIDRHRGLLQVHPERSAAEVIKTSIDLVRLRGGLRGLPTCKTLQGRATLTSTAREAAAVTRFDQVLRGLQEIERRGERFLSGWSGRSRGTWSSNGGASVASPFNPQCGQFNCFAVALAKARSLATGRPYSASAIRPTALADVGVTNAEVENVLSPISQASGRARGGATAVRNQNLYSLQELIDHTLGRPSPMDQARMTRIMAESGAGAQGLVFVRYRSSADPSKMLRHVFNGHNDNGVVRFVDETLGAGQDGSSWFDRAVDLFFHEYNYLR